MLGSTVVRVRTDANATEEDACSTSSSEQPADEDIMDRLDGTPDRDSRRSNVEAPVQAPSAPRASDSMVSAGHGEGHSEAWVIW